MPINVEDAEGFASQLQAHYDMGPAALGVVCSCMWNCCWGRHRFGDRGGICFFPPGVCKCWLAGL
eukprot:4041288-Amphidinium_carterae.2